MVKFSISLTTCISILVIGLNNDVFAAGSERLQNLQPSDPGYVGALNDRPSNGPSETTEPTTGTIKPLNADYWYQYEPSTIKVLMREKNDPTATGPVKSYDFGYYLQNVLPNEWFASWPSEALKAGAVSVRSYAWYCTNHYKYPNIGAALDNTINSQVFKPGTAVSKTNSAISATSGEALIYGGTEIPGYYKAGSYGPDRDSSSYNINNNAYQNGEHYWADQGKTYRWMLTYYYPGTSIITGNGD
ncbi:SpoIID/LytB domain-containing protein [Geobacillus sp. YF-1]|uniref:SpoIID/LytB domain-containing protein n=1 Tax=Geobacillus sp. YF-1 TaxID=3457480 RepID=UPI00404520A7